MMIFYGVSVVIIFFVMNMGIDNGIVIVFCSEGYHVMVVSNVFLVLVGDLIGYDVVFWSVFSLVGFFLCSFLVIFWTM